MSGTSTCRGFFNIIFNLISAAQLLVAQQAAQPSQWSESILGALGFSPAKHWNSFAATALDTLRRPGCSARARAHLYVCVVMLCASLLVSVFMCLPYRFNYLVAIPRHGVRSVWSSVPVICSLYYFRCNFMFLNGNCGQCAARS